MRMWERQHETGRSATVSEVDGGVFAGRPIGRAGEEPGVEAMLGVGHAVTATPQDSTGRIDTSQP